MIFSLHSSGVFLTETALSDHLSLAVTTFAPGMLFATLKKQQKKYLSKQPWYEIERCTMQQKYERFVFAVILTAGLLSSSLSGCSVFRATGRSVEAVGAGAGDAVAGTGRAITRGASETEREIRR